MTSNEDAVRHRARNMRRRARCYKPLMRFVVRHESTYRYSVPVRLAPHVLRLNPRPESLRILARTLNAQPQPYSRMERVDEFGNGVTDLSFLGSTQLLHIESEFELETFAPAPLLQPWAALPWWSSPSDGLAQYRLDGLPDASVQRFASDLAAQVGHAPLAFLDELTRTIFTRTDQNERLSGEARPAATTLANWEGACRDTAVLFVAACRCLGMAARFTSGYLAPLDGLDAQRQLHAWPEVFLPGSGWRGWDPSQGKRVLENYVPLCAAPSQSGTMPVEGGYYFSAAVVNTTLDFKLRISIG
jgi:transglutaminase-like putative cysteine protease